MFEELIKTDKVLTRYRNAPLALEREEFLRHFHQQGHSLWRVRAVNSMLMAIASNIEWHDGAISTEELITAAGRWLGSKARRHEKERSAQGMRQDFVSIGTQWLRFAGRFVEMARPPAPFETESDSFLLYLSEERGLSSYTVALRRRSLGHFLNWLAGKNCAVGEVTPSTITEYFSVERGWARATVKFHVNTLRSFFRFAASKAWCDAKLGGAIYAPRIFAYESLPQGLKWTDVERLINGLSGAGRKEIRDRAAILLLALYGLRMKEVVTLTLDDLDWSTERINVHRSKQRKRQCFPLCTEVGEAIIRYLHEVRPYSSHRQLFLTERMPHRPYSRCGLSKAITARIKNLGVTLTHYGPHVFRHACATHLLARGFSFKEIGDHLGHRTAQATRIYAKVDLISLRQVADFRLSGLAEDANVAESLGPNHMAPEKLSALRDLANIGIGGVA
jgi:site-specific recombinase XerD